MRMITVIFCLAPVASGSPALAQSFNLDAGGELGLPSASYGGAAGQPGEWLELSFNVEQVVPLMDIAGEATSVTLSSPLPFGPSFSLHDGPTGGDEALLEDYLDLHSTPAALEIAGLQAGRYTIYTYAWAPDDSRFSTIVTVGEDSQTIGGAWSGALELGVTHARHEVEVAAGGTVTLHTFGLTKGTLNGMQIVAQPDEPSPEATPESSPEPVAEPAPEAVAEPAPEVGPEPAPEPAPEAAAEIDEGAITAEDSGCTGSAQGGPWLLGWLLAVLLGARRRRSMR